MSPDDFRAWCLGALFLSCAVFLPVSIVFGIRDSRRQFHEKMRAQNRELALWADELALRREELDMERDEQDRWD